MKILIVYGTTEGQTRKIARFLKDEAEKSGHQVTLSDSTQEPPSPAGYDIVLIGASVHAHKYQSSVVHYVKEFADILNKIKCGFFSVSMAAASDNAESQAELNEVTLNFMKETGWEKADVEQVAGALLYTKYDFFKKLIMRMIVKRRGGNTDTSGDYEYTDWTKMKSFLERVLKN
jgi:menaquinone-dependent protoporphyrinogen oxidase